MALGHHRCERLRGGAMATPRVRNQDEHLLLRPARKRCREGEWWRGMGRGRPCSRCRATRAAEARRLCGLCRTGRPRSLRGGGASCGSPPHERLRLPHRHCGAATAAASVARRVGWRLGHDADAEEPRLPLHMVVHALGNVAREASGEVSLEQLRERRRGTSELRAHGSATSQAGDAYVAGRSVWMPREVVPFASREIGSRGGGGRGQADRFAGRSARTGRSIRGAEREDRQGLSEALGLPERAGIAAAWGGSVSQGQWRRPRPCQEA
jgi:hypothetical protein